MYIVQIQGVSETSVPEITRIDSRSFGPFSNDERWMALEAARGSIIISDFDLNHR